MCKIIKFPTRNKQVELTEQPHLEPQPNSMYEMLRHEYFKKYGWSTLGTFENWLRENHYYDDLYTIYWEEYKQKHHNGFGDNEEAYTNWIREELSKEYLENANINYFDE